MELRWLGWAGVELAVGDVTVVIDPLQDATAVFAWLGDRAGAVPGVTAPRAGSAVAGLVTHLHRDHADAGALRAALARRAPVFEPEAAAGDELENLAVAQAEHELAPFERRRFRAWESADAGPFRITALPAVDGTGDPQVSWLVEGDGLRVLHLGDTIFHGYWWRMARRHGPFDAVCVPVNGAVLSFPHRRPPSPFAGALDPDHAAVAARILGAGLAIPIHAHGYEVEGVYEPVPAAQAKFEVAADVPVRALELGETLDLTAVHR